ncbi:hypothetical protein SAMN05660657_02788 [Geodermatophilus amargosae]|uniref:Lipoprotein n=1 Tax=Geodermatophilus amargosae TaxID=1296565 RepID=A0A1I7AIK5_9ACTN|nr:hypothetical protein [Geodermatophilus amargosae]SFT74738.1 hypothetical protein SAMN05660657_02788 [Geodermatophilus amargosae]
MRTPRRLAALVLAVSASAALAACSSPVSGTATPVPQGQEASTDPAAPPVEEAGDTDPAPDEAPGTAPGTGTTDADDDLPVPGAGVPGDAGLCQAVVGWFGYAGLSLVSVDENGHVDPATVVPLLEAMRDAPADHQDAGAPLLAAADDVSAAADEAIDLLESGTDVLTAFESLTQPVTDFAAACTSAGVTV